MVKIVLFTLIFFQGIVNASSGFYINASYSQSNRNIEYVPQSIGSITTTVSGTSFTLKPPTGTKNFTDQQNGFEISTGYKFHKYGVPFFFSPQIDFFRTQNESGLTTLSAIGKLGFEFNNPYTPFSIYGFGGVAGVKNSNVSGKNSEVFGFKYGAGVELFVHKNIALFTEVFRIDLSNSIPSSTTTASTSTNTYETTTVVEDYMTANNGGGTVVVTNTTTTDTFTLNKLQLSDYIDVNSVTYQTTDKLTDFTKASSSTFITSIVGFKTGITIYFGNDNSDNNYYNEAKF